MIDAPVPGAFAFTGRGFAVAHGGPLGTSYAFFRDPVALAPDASGCLGGLGAHGGAPAIAASGETLVVAFVEDGRPFVAIVGDAGAHVAPIDGEAHDVAVDVDPDGALVVAADRDGLYSVRVTLGPEPALAPPVRHVARGDVRGPLRIARVTRSGGGSFVFYALSDAALGVLFVEPRGRARDVRYALHAPCVHLDVTSDARGAAIALAYDGDRVDGALFDAEGRAINRPHVALRDQGARFVSAQAAWFRRRYAFGGVDAVSGDCLLDGAASEPPIRLAGFGPGRLALTRRRDQWLGLQLAADGARLGLAVRTLDLGGTGESGVRWFAPDGAEAREARRRAADLLRAVHGELSRASYRDAGALSIDAAALTLHLAEAGEDAAALALRFAPDPSALALELELAEAVDEPSLGERVARLFKGDPREARWEAWARELADGLLALTEVTSRAARGRRTLRLGLASPPTGRALSELLRRARRSARAMVGSD